MLGSRVRIGPLAALAWVACRPTAGPVEHPDDPIHRAPVASADPDRDTPRTPAEDTSGPGIAYTQAIEIELARDAIPCPDACARGEARGRCSVSADIRFLDLVVTTSHAHVRETLERSPGIDACFAAIADPRAELLPSFRIPLDFVIGPRGELQAREDPLHASDRELEQMLDCVGAWLDGLSFPPSGRSHRARVRMSVEPTGRCTD